MTFQTEAEYEEFQKNQKLAKKAEFLFVKFLRLIVYLTKSFLVLLLEVFKGVLKTLGLPIK